MDPKTLLYEGAQQFMRLNALDLDENVVDCKNCHVVIVRTKKTLKAVYLIPPKPFIVWEWIRYLIRKLLLIEQGNEKSTPLRLYIEDYLSKILDESDDIEVHYQGSELLIEPVRFIRMQEMIFYDECSG